ncbi:MAG: Gfo/Idh/MocA family oxidoreductase [Planctomycetes bacterium]|nr:Gfo/Idh/MocA family oxidoreductase [Planctomycetota bacterium]
MTETIRVVVVGCGNMGSSHARAYASIEGFDLVGLVAPTSQRRDPLAKELGGIPQFERLDDALESTQPHAVSICSYPDTHAPYAMQALEQGMHLFIEKPLAQTVQQARQVVALAQKKTKKVVVGYILRHSPAWIEFINIARTLGKPLVMRMNLNQQSSSTKWHVHKQLMNSMSPIVDCGVHYVDIMCQMTRAKPLRVHAVGARLSDEIDADMYNYGHLQVVFDDSSVGWYESGWGPMMSETAYSIKDVVGPKGAVSILDPTESRKGASDDIDSHTHTKRLKKHLAELDPNEEFQHKDVVIDTSDEPGHQQLCDIEQAYFLKTIREDLDLTDHLNDAVNSLRIVLAADESIRTEKIVNLE